jgi:hypothetical protein
LKVRKAEDLEELKKKNGMGQRHTNTGRTRFFHQHHGKVRGVRQFGMEQRNLFLWKKGAVYRGLGGKVPIQQCL